MSVTLSQISLSGSYATLLSPSPTRKAFSLERDPKLPITLAIDVSADDADTYVLQPGVGSISANSVDFGGPVTGPLYARVPSGKTTTASVAEIS